MHTLITYLIYILIALKKHAGEAAGTASGIASGFYAMITHKIDVQDDLHAIVIAFLTGMAGFFGALVCKWIIKLIKPDEQIPE